MKQTRLRTRNLAQSKVRLGIIQLPIFVDSTDAHENESLLSGCRHRTLGNDSDSSVATFTPMKNAQLSLRALSRLEFEGP
jgi:hypothetical protein